MTKHREADLLGRKRFNEDYGTFYITAGTEDEHNKTDIYATAITNPQRIYTIEIKNYEDPQHPRPYSKFIYNGKDYGYQIDWDKVHYLMTLWKEEGRIPIIYARFYDYTYVWDLRYIDTESRKKQVWTIRDGMNYGGNKELTWQTYLYKDEAVTSKPTTRYNS